MTFGEMIKAIREDKGISATEIAKKIGKTSGFICNLENGRDKAPIKKTVYKIAEALGEEPQELWELAANERFKIWAEKEGIESAKTLVFFQDAVATTKAMAKRISKLIKAGKVQKAAALALVSLPNLVTSYILSDTSDKNEKNPTQNKLCWV